MNSSGKNNVNTRDASGVPPLFWAAFKGHVHIVDYLLAFGADVDERVFGMQCS